jgi:hypothetical protein
MGFNVRSSIKGRETSSAPSSSLIKCLTGNETKGNTSLSLGPTKKRKNKPREDVSGSFPLHFILDGSGPDVWRTT